MATNIPPLHFGRDDQSYNAYAPAPSTVKYSATITNGSATNTTVPSSFAVWLVSFRYYPNNVWVDVSGATAATPAGATLASTTSEMNPASLTLNAGTVISMITAQTAADVSIVMWPVSYP
jgi:hypothetical protein